MKRSEKEMKKLLCWCSFLFFLSFNKTTTTTSALLFRNRVKREEIERKQVIGQENSKEKGRKKNKKNKRNNTAGLVDRAWVRYREGEGQHTRI